MGEIWTRHQAKDKWRTTAAGLLAAAKSHVEDGSPDAAMKEMEEASLLWQKSTVWKQNARTALELARTTSGDLKRQQSESSDSVPWAYSSTAKLLNGLQSRLAEGDGQQALADVNQAKSDLPAIEQIISRHKEVLRIDDTLTPLDQIHEARVERQNQRKFLSDADEHLRAGRLPECSAGLTQVEKNLAEIPVIALRALSRASEQSLKVQQADKTLQLIEQALAIVTDHQDAPLIKSECLVVRANLNSREGDFGHAITDCEESLLLQPSVSAHVLLASIYNATEKFDAALAESEAAILLDADSPEALNQRGYAHYRKAEFNEALRDFESTLKLSGDFADAITNRGLVCFDQGDYVKALADFDHALRLQPDDVQALVGRAGISRLNGEYRRAIQDCDKALAIHSGFSDALVCRGAAKLGMGDAESAIVDLKNAVTLNPDDLAAHIFLATAWNQKHEWQSAVEECGSALRRGITSAIRRVYQAQRLCFCGS
ncbi:MAG TPA: tetratricopeptide repeat protein [Planctomycetaceae bacterium]|nr:tetratricopeptide repeat protein [Planctomycetaceae bacterium]